mmetsp:Transcript_17200/g.54440  ORF Transcript_17200/g.54440 Transcript_17200/m.54440 type:complete len:201 (+) Transcript_17200:347-949(+)
MSLAYSSSRMPRTSDASPLHIASATGAASVAADLFHGAASTAPDLHHGGLPGASITPLSAAALPRPRPASTRVMSTAPRRPVSDSLAVPLRILSSAVASLRMRSPSGELKSSSVSSSARALSRDWVVGPRMRMCGGSSSDSSRAESPGFRVPLPRTMMDVPVSACIRFCVRPRGPMTTPTMPRGPPDVGWSGRISLSDMS